jgi:hypothetical protein
LGRFLKIIVNLHFILYRLKDSPRTMKKNLTSSSIAETAHAGSMRWVFTVPQGTVFLSRPIPFLVRR